jgi:isochorismate pyruvate lyase
MVGGMSEADDKVVLKECRARIDAVDEDIVALLARRMAVVDSVIALKRERGIPALLPERVDEVLDHVRSVAEVNNCPPDLAEIVYRAVIAWTIEHEQVALTGEE